MSPITVREALRDELDTVGATMVAAYAEFSPSLPPAGWQVYAEEIRDVRSRMDDSVLIVAAEGDRILGAVTYYPDATKEPHAAWPASWANFRLLAVHPDARGLRLGRLLTEECIRRARSTHREAIGLHTTKLMNVARAMYERMGFVRVPELDFAPMPNLHVMAYRLTL